MSIKPINNHILIEPVKHDSFIASTKETFEEIGIVVDIDESLKNLPFMKGARVFFDSWLAVKYPKNENEYYWLVEFKDIRAYEIPE